MSLAVGVDLGGSTLRAALVDAQGDIVRAVRRPLGERSPEAVVDQLALLLGELAPPPGAPMAVGLAGSIRSHGGVVALAPNLGWRELPFGALLAARFGGARLVNDLGAITVGEAERGAGRGARDVVCVFVGTGVGMGAVVGGALLEGHGGLAAELGHAKVVEPEQGRLCGCGERGCLEAYVGGRHLPALLGEQLAAGVASDRFRADDPVLASVDAAVLEEAAAAGDPAALAVWRRAAELLGRALGTVIAVLSPRGLVLGGGVLRRAPHLRALVGERLQANGPRPQLAELVIRDSELGDDAGLVGAGLLAHRERR